MNVTVQEEAKRNPFEEVKPNRRKSFGANKAPRNPHYSSVSKTQASPEPRKSR